MRNLHYYSAPNRKRRISPVEFPICITRSRKYLVSSKFLLKSNCSMKTKLKKAFGIRTALLLLITMLAGAGSAAA